MRLRSSVWAAPIVAVMQLEPVSAQSAISVGLMITIIGGVAYLSRVLTRIEEQQKSMNEKVGELRPLPARMSLVENHIKGLEDDVNNLWAEQRKMRPPHHAGDERDDIRRERGPRMRDDDRNR